MRIEGLSAIVTGGASGLGAATAAMLAERGARVTILDMNAAAGEAHAAAIGGRFIRADVVSEDEIAAALAQAEAWHGRARILVNCAGIGDPRKIIDRDGAPLSVANFGRIVSVNLLGTYNVMSKFAARIHAAERIGEEGGVIVNTASVAAFDGQIGQASYSASKGGIVGLTLPAAREFARYGIRVMTIAPGIFWTPILSTLSEEALDSLGRQIPFPSRLGRPEEYAQLVEAIVTNPMLNGETIRLDGAVRMAPK